jgi:hypothetical protein
MAYNIRTLQYLKESHVTSNDNDNIKQIYVKNRQRDPPPATITIENKTTAFEKQLKSLQTKVKEKNKNINHFNLTKPQLQTLRSLKNNNEFTIKPSDKNLGPVIMNTDDYVKMVLTQHLLTTDYQQLPPEVAKNHLENITNTLKSLLQDHKDTLSMVEQTFFTRSLQLHHRIPLFYGIPKVHKTPTALRPVVSTVNSLLSVFSTWLDYQMKKLLPFTKSYLKNSKEVKEDLKTIHIPPNAFLFSAGATAMYTNIDSDTGLSSISELLQTNSTDIPTNFPTQLFLKVLEIIMKNNILQFRSTYWLQLYGTAMGTPTACA